MLAKKHNLNSLWATIDTSNKASIKAHLKAGFKYFPKEEIKKCQKLGFMEPKETRLYKNY